ncbi:MAG: AAA family ATPase, partial [Betaproteobacteria bacterium]
VHRRFRHQRSEGSESAARRTRGCRMSDVRKWLERLGLGEYAQSFENERIELEDLIRLDAADLKEMGLPIGPRKRVLEAISKINTAAKSKTASHDQSSSLESIVEQDAERRQLTVLFCDMVGFTELASRLDPEVLQTIVRSYEDTCAAAITRYDGYVYQRLGDGIVAFFGYPLAHEGEAERAIRAGLDIIDALSTLRVPEVESLSVRIAIATGMVVVTSAEKGAVGETMNLASRLQAVAPVNTIVVSERVRRLAGGSFEYEDLGQQTLKGISAPTHAYRIVGVSTATGRFEAAHSESLTPLVGRDLELGLLMDRWAHAQEGEGQVVLLSGEPGIGKSRILSALRERLESGGVKSLHFHCSPYHVNSAFWPTIVNFERALKFTRDESSESKLDKLESLIVGHYGRPLSDVRFIAGMLSIPCEERYGEISMTPQKFKDETLRTLVDLTEATAKKRPSEVLFEDVHWADPTTLEVLDLLIDRIKDIPLLIVMTHRPEFQNRWSEHGHVSSLNLSKLTRTQSRALISGLTDGRALPDDLLEQIVARTDGVPLFVEELTKSILESDELTDAGDQYEYAGGSQSVPIPATLRDSLTARLDRTAPVKEVAQIGAAIGREFTYELISAVAPLPKGKLDEGLAQLTDSGLAFRRGTPPEANYTFKHALVQDAAYDSMLKSWRQELHGKIVRVIEERFPAIASNEPEVLAHHEERAGLTDQAIAHRLLAGQRATRRSANVEAVRQLELALELVPTLEHTQHRDRTELRLRVALGTPLIASSDLAHASDQVRENFDKSAELCDRVDDPALLFPALFGQCVSLHASGLHHKAWSIADRIHVFADTYDDRVGRLTGYRMKGVLKTMTGNLKEARDYLEYAISTYEPDADKGLHLVFGQDPNVAALSYLALVLSLMGYSQQAADIEHQAIKRAEEMGHPFSHCYSLFWAGCAATMVRGDSETLIYRANELASVSKAQGFRFWFDMSQFFLAFAHCNDERLSAGCFLENDPHASWPDRLMGKIIFTTFCSVLSTSMMATPEALGASLERIDKAIGIAEDGAENWALPEMFRIRGCLLLQSIGHDDQAEEDFKKSIEMAHTQQARLWELRTSVSLARLWQSQGKHKQAHDLLEPVYSWFTEGFDTKDLKEAKALLEELRRDEHSRVA